MLIIGVLSVNVFLYWQFIAMSVTAEATKSEPENPSGS